jgi:lipopolysaccharide export system protein LptC
MKRIVVMIAGFAAIAAAAIYWTGWTARSTPATTAARPDSVWYHASDVKLLAATGRPQLVEFFHPD